MGFAPQRSTGYRSLERYKLMVRPDRSRPTLPRRAEDREDHDPAEQSIAEAAPAMRLARDILTAEGMDPESSGSASEACVLALQRLYDKLRPMVGNGGFESLLGRAMVLTVRRHADLDALPVPRAGLPPHGELERALLNADGDSSGPAEQLLGEFLAFAGYLLGWGLLLVILRDLWPEAPTGYDADELRHTPRSSNVPQNSDSHPRGSKG